MKYIFVAGAPGSKWSSVAKNIYYSPDVDRSDFTEARTYWHDASGVRELMHLGAYWDPGMEFGSSFEFLNRLSREQAEAEFDRPFSGGGIRIIKSHYFCRHVDYLKANWPDCSVVAVSRSDDACLGWWVKCGEFGITYPNYQHYDNLKRMGFHIALQNSRLRDAVAQYPRLTPRNNVELCSMLGIRHNKSYFQDYKDSDIGVSVL